MKNLLKYFEQYAEWMALGLGALFVLYVVYSFVVTAPVKITAGPKEVTPGTVDQITADGPGEQLRLAMNGTDVPVMKVEQFAERFKAAIQGEGATEVTLSSMFLSPTLRDIGGGPMGPTVATVKGGIVDTLPIAPPAVPVGNASGLSMVAKPKLDGLAPGADVKTIPVGGQQDIEWVTAFFKISHKDLQASFEKAKIPDTVSRTSIIEVELIRQEMQPDGTWGEEEVIDPLPTQVIPPFPEGNDRAEQIKYKDWAEKNASTVIEPGFYQVLSGDVWHRYDETVDAPVQNVIPKIEPPKKPDAPKKTPPKRTPTKTEPPKTTPHKSGGAPQMPNSGGRKSYAPKDPGPAAPPPAPAGNRPPPPRPGGGANDAKFITPGAMPGGMAPPMINPGGQRPAQQTAQQAKDAGSPITGPFDPSQLQDDILVWAHDDSVHSGKTYHYKVRYRIRNPVFQTRNVAANQKLSDTFDIQSEDSEWSDPVTIKPRTNFWIVHNVNRAGVVAIEVFMWKEGKQTSQIFEVSPGDLVGGDTEFNTGWTVVDFRQDNVLDDNAVILVDENGNLLKRSYNRDARDPQYNQLKQQVGAAAGQPQASAGGH